MTLSSQLPRTSPTGKSFFAAHRTKLVPISLALFGSACVVAATVYFSSGDATPTMASVPSNTVPPPVTVAASAPAPIAQKPAALPPVSAKPGSTAVALTTPIGAVTSTARSASAPAAAPIARSSQSRMNFATAIAMAQADPVGARLALTQLIDRRELAANELAAAAHALREINSKIFFSPTVVVGDSTTRTYVVQSGDSLSRIAKRNDVQTDWRLIQRINSMKSEKALRVGQNLKIPVGAFHAEVSKSDYQLRIYAGEGEQRVIVAIFTVGLGELNSTPTGAFMVRPKSKLINPEWNNPRTGEHFASDDPKNPIGERWIGLIGVEAHNQGTKGYGIHGTVDPASIGKQASMGCVRMSDADVEVVYELLTEPNSTIMITP